MRYPVYIEINVGEDLQFIIHAFSLFNIIQFIIHASMHKVFVYDLN